MVACGGGGGGSSFQAWRGGELPSVRGGGGSFQVWFHQNTDVYSSHFFIAAAPLLTRRRTDNCNEETGWGKRPHSSAKPNLEAAPLAPLLPHPSPPQGTSVLQLPIRRGSSGVASSFYSPSLSLSDIACSSTHWTIAVPDFELRRREVCTATKLPLNVLLPSWVVVRRVLGSLYFPCKMEFVWNRLIILGLVAVVARTEVSFMHT